MNEEAEQLVLCIARENPRWGYDNIQGALANLKHYVSDQMIGNIRKRHGVEPAPKRKRKKWAGPLARLPVASVSVGYFGTTIARPRSSKSDFNRLSRRWSALLVDIGLSSRSVPC